MANQLAEGEDVMYEQWNSGYRSQRDDRRARTNFHKKSEPGMDVESFKKQTASLIEGIAKALVDDPSSVKVEIQHGEQTIVFCLYTNPQERGKVIGKMGRTANSFRTILSGIAAKSRFRAILEIVE
jgi:uncharacterized protein